MNSIKIKNKIAKYCNGNMHKYFNMVEIANWLILKKNLNLSEVDFFDEVSLIYFKNIYKKTLHKQN